MAKLQSDALVRRIAGQRPNSFLPQVGQHTNATRTKVDSK